MQFSLANTAQAGLINHLLNRVLNIKVAKCHPLLLQAFHTTAAPYKHSNERAKEVSCKLAACHCKPNQNQEW